MVSSWQEVAARVQKHRDETIARVEPALAELDFEIPYNVTAIPRRVLTPRECEITELTVEELRARLDKGSLSAVETINAFLRRAALAQKLVCYLDVSMPVIGFRSHQFY
jgi:amidase